ncbi:unnamed protein product [Paramecium octaurelia]|uniref:Uncharacterized protein n=1 Tax=Paramecium octaurelia TaxID=43137 RepID=A0A8S1T7F8_PAROT|nr:unnamed protein product [Paramecium octaurelia]
MLSQFWLQIDQQLTYQISNQLRINFNGKSLLQYNQSRLLNLLITEIDILIHSIYMSLILRKDFFKLFEQYDNKRFLKNQLAKKNYGRLFSSCQILK